MYFHYFVFTTVGNCGILDKRGVNLSDQNINKQTYECCAMELVVADDWACFILLLRISLYQPVSLTLIDWSKTWADILELI